MATQKNLIKMLTLCLLAATMLSPILLSTAQAQSATTVGDWALDETKDSGSTTITPDATGVNSGILAGDPHPSLVDGQSGKAMQFNGENAIYVPIKFVVGFPPMDEPMYVPISTNLDIQQYITVNAWINVPGYKNATYNNIVVKCDHPDQACAWQNTTRVLGLALRAGTPSNEDYVEGALSGFIMTESGGFNEIVTTQPIPLNTWINVEFTRTASGMHLYINNQEQTVKVLSGTQNPSGNILNGTEYYFGHDSLAAIDNIKISDLAPDTTENAFEIGTNLMVVIIVVSLIFAVAWLLRRAIQLWIIRPKI